MKTTIHSAVSGHTLYVATIARADLPEKVANNESSAAFTTFYVVKNWDAAGPVFMYLAKGAANAPREICAFYRNGAFWSSYGGNLKAAIEGAQKDGWMYV